MNGTEFFVSPSGNVMMDIPGEEGAKELSQTDYEFVNEMYDTIRSFYPSAFSCLEKIYKASVKNEPYYKFLIVRRFIKCNFGLYDKQRDIDEFGNFHFEFVHCPLRGECQYENTVCSPQFNSSLSEREMEVMQMYSSGVTVEDISGRLFLSAYTVKNHIRNSFRKVRVHSLAEFINYAGSHNLFR